MYLMRSCDNFDQLFVYSSSPTKRYPILYRPVDRKEKKNVNAFRIPCLHDHENYFMEKEVG